MQCAPSLDQLETYPIEFLRLILTAHGVLYDEDYDRYDVLALTLLAFKIDCPRYSKKEIENIKQGKNIPSSDPNQPLVVSRLFPLQRKNVDEMLSIIKRHYVLLNTSDPGSGKTIMSFAFSSLADKSIYVVTKANIVPSWAKTADFYKVDNLIGITSYELGVRGKEYKLGSYYKKDKQWKAVPVDSRYVTREETTRKGAKKRAALTWKGLKNTIIVFDEPHNSKNTSSYAHDLLIACYEFVKRESDKGNILLLLGATPTDKSTNIGYLEHVLELKKETRREKLRRAEDDTPFLRLHRILYDPEDPRATRVSKEALEEQLGISPPVTVTIQAYSMSPKAARVIEEQNQIIADLIRGIRTTKARTTLKEIQDARRIIELQKVPTFVNLAVMALEQGRSVIIFVEFYNTSNALAEQLEKYHPRLLRGKTAKKQRPLIMEQFQYGEFDLLIAHHAVAREGISLHDIVGGHPRTVIISPVWGGITFVQVLGRADRLCRLSDTEQLVVYAQSTDPENPGWDARVAEVMANKIKNIKEMNVGEAAEDFMKTLYVGATEVKNVDYRPKVVKLSSKRYVGENIPSSEEAEAEVEFEQESGLRDEPDSP